ncbi:MAG: prepilin-type N-terminal cleavage/methylation domain-containing protein [Holophaga sp.]|nr:prepilin-type N-terminal cleavage/methylation domain-containing protein [Holophaga sp.]
MKKESGFTLIELLLVLAIIGIISAIAIPALLGQRARARDKSAISNLDNMMSDAVAQWDKHREAGSTPSAIAAEIATYMTTNHSKDLNPWNAASKAYASSFSETVTGKATVSAFLTDLTATSMGQVQMFLQTPQGSLPGFTGGAVKINGLYNGSSIVRKATSVE